MGRIGIGEEQSTGCQLVDVRGLCLRVSGKARNPVIEIINGNEEHIWSFFRLFRPVIGMSSYYGSEQCNGNAGRSGDVDSASHFVAGKGYLNAGTIFLNSTLMASRVISVAGCVCTEFGLLRAQVLDGFLYSRKMELEAFLFQPL